MVLTGRESPRMDVNSCQTPPPLHRLTRFGIESKQSLNWRLLLTIQAGTNYLFDFLTIFYPQRRAITGSFLAIRVETSARFKAKRRYFCCKSWSDQLIGVSEFCRKPCSNFSENSFSGQRYGSMLLEYCNTAVLYTCTYTCTYSSTSTCTRVCMYLLQY